MILSAKGTTKESNFNCNPFDNYTTNGSLIVHEEEGEQTLLARRVFSSVVNAPIVSRRGENLISRVKGFMNHR